ncbi:MAG: flagellar protein FlgJ [Gammaproteobacteria bacterium]|nr:flagellar protein FlgJ [Gammaproteobacteria bacterium]
MTAPVPDTSVYADTKGLAALKRGAQAHDPKAIREAARQFESLFTRMMLKSMREASPKDSLAGSDQQDFYQGMYDDQLAVELSKGRGLGLADMLVQQLTRAGLVPADMANSAGGGAVTGGTASSAPAATKTLIGASAGEASATSATASGAAKATGSPTTQNDFVRAVWPSAQAAGRELGVDPNNIVAQAALETGWGRSVPADAQGNSSFNLFGIKAGDQWTGGSVGARTLEFSGGVPVARTEKFRAYGSTADSVKDYVNLIRDNPRYAAALNTGSDTGAFAGALSRGGYSTDPAYAQKLSAIAQNVAEMTTGLKSAAARPIDPTTRLL